MGRRPAPMVADFAAHLARGELAVLEDGGGVVAGYVVMFAKPGAWFVENVAVDPVRHGTGLGRALMGHAESAARAAGHGRLTLYTNIHMTENLAFYPRLGFSETHRVTEDGFDRVYMEKVL
ncbi:MAG: GNAT family N-acetyltransferase [Hyphomicrobiales bacterium]|nr:GNAT family N-acetyltransferase [Hyphomicrobiales bacterium]